MWKDDFKLFERNGKNLYLKSHYVENIRVYVENLQRIMRTMTEHFLIEYVNNVQKMIHIPSLKGTYHAKCTF